MPGRLQGVCQVGESVAQPPFFDVGAQLIALLCCEILVEYANIRRMERESHFIGQSSAFLDAVERASRAAALNRPVLVIGERGTGKELVAERLHRLSPRWRGPLVTMNCAALPETLIEAELFGHDAGAFTGAVRARAGRFEEADGGTLFLDELATLSAAAQERLLRATEYGEVTRIGSNRPLKVDVRIVAATNEHLPGLVEQGRFRADLLDRLSFEVVTLPPLRVREGDVAVLADHFARRMAAELDWPQWPGFGASATAMLEAHDWPGNVRELRNVVERAVYRWDDPGRPVDAIEFDPFVSPWRPVTLAKEERHSRESGNPASSPPVERQGDPSFRWDDGDVECDDFRAACLAHEKRLLEAALARCRYNQRATAAALKLTYDQLRHALRRHDLLDRAA
jgi:psp operon transcriptional activator